MKKSALALSIALAFAAPAFCQRLDVKIINREDSSQSYEVAASGDTMSAHATFQVTGSTLTLKLPDGRVALVNCSSKYQMQGNYVNRRSCRVPLVDSIQADFHADSAKLTWIVSIDGKKTQSETYKILAVYDKP
ncbi:MAG: hypothetical protein ACLP1Y_04290 [Candidatus Acidiferrales bacterium]